MKKRGAGKSNAAFGREDMYRQYLSNIKDLSSNYKVTEKQYGKILNSFNKEVSRLMMEEAFEFIIPRNLGTMRVKKYKPTLVTKDGDLNTRHLNVDWQATNKMWDNDPKTKEAKKVVYFQNDHSEGYNYRWYFSNYRSTCKNKSAYCFKPTRYNKRRLAQLVKDVNFKGDWYE